MKKINLDLGAKKYDIITGSGVRSKLPGIIKSMGIKGPVIIVTDRTVWAKTKKIAEPVLDEIPNEVIRITVPGSETSKTIDVFADSVARISKKTKNHKPFLVALGGGVVGDLTGFIAATYRRGVPYIQLPTTLLAQVDSSIGGKVGIDIPEAKNMIGAFCHPESVLADTDFLKTLPRKQMCNGVSEVIKYGIIGSRVFFDFLEDNMRSIFLQKKDVMGKVVRECAACKARVVEKDEYDRKDIRIALNFGHTIGHAIEAASGYSNMYNHGESIAVGMLVACEIAVHLGMFPEKDLKRVRALISRAALPVSVKGVTIRGVMSSCGYDKKFVEGHNRFVLPRKIGSVEVVEDIPELLIKNVLRKYVSK